MTSKLYQARLNGALIKPGSVTTTQIADETITSSDVSPSAAIPIAKLAHIGQNWIFRSDSIRNIGGQLVNQDVSPAAGIAVSKLAAGGTANRVVRTTDGTTLEMGQVIEAMIAANAVTVNVMADQTVTEPKLANNAVTTNKVADNTITTGKIAANAVSQVLFLGSSTGFSVAGNNWNWDAAAGGLKGGFTTRGGPVLLFMHGSFYSAIAGRYIRTSLWRNGAGAPISQSLDYCPNSSIGYPVTLIAVDVPPAGAYQWILGMRANEADNTVYWFPDGARYLMAVELAR